MIVCQCHQLRAEPAGEGGRGAPQGAGGAHSLSSEEEGQQSQEKDCVPGGEKKVGSLAGAEGIEWWQRLSGKVEIRC